MKEDPIKTPLNPPNKPCPTMKIINLSKEIAGVVGVLYLSIEAVSLFAIIKILGENGRGEIASIWVFFTAMLPLAQLAISGYSPLITRELAKVNGTTNVSCSKNNNIENEAAYLFKKSIIFIFLCLIGAAAYLYKNNESQFVIPLALYFFGVFARASILYMAAFFLGFNKYGLDKIVMLTCTTGAIVLVYVSSKLSQQLSIIAASYAFPYVAGAVASKYMLAKIIKKENNLNGGTKVLLNKEIFKMYLVNLAGFLTLNTDVLIAKLKFDNDIFSEYGLLSKVAMGMVALSGIVITLQMPSYSALYGNGKTIEMKKKVLRTSMQVTLSSMLIGAILLLIHDQIAPAILNRPPAISNSIVVMLLLFVVTVINIMNIGAGIIATGDSKLVNIALPIATVGFVASIFGALLYGVIGMVLTMVLFGAVSLLLHARLFSAITGD